MHDDPVEEVFEDQIACADLVVLNKRELLDADGLTRARAAIADALPGSVKVLTASGGKVELLLEEHTTPTFVVRVSDRGPGVKDLQSIQNRQISVENIQKTVADYFKIKVSEMYSKKRFRSVARPRQVAMARAKELTQQSLPEIGEAFGGRDHTTVLHACRKTQELRDTDQEFARDYAQLQQILLG